MDWFSWLSKTNLDPSLIYEYGLIFAHNELEEEDIPYFNHEFLQSMGISVAKHRLEILKLARKQKGSVPNSISKLLTAIKKTKSRLSNYVRMWVRREDSGSLAIVPARRSYSSSSRWKNAMVKRKKKLMVSKENSNRLLLTNGSPLIVPSGRIDSFSGSPVSCDPTGEGEGDECLSIAFEDIRWDSMFQNLKPT